MLVGARSGGACVNRMIYGERPLPMHTEADWGILAISSSSAVGSTSPLTKGKPVQTSVWFWS